MGLIVDAVSDVLDVHDDAIEPTPSLSGIDTSFITGLAKSGDRLVTVLNIEELLATKPTNPHLPSTNHLNQQTLKNILDRGKS